MDNSRDTGHTILTPSIRPARSHLERETVPRITIRRVVFTDGTLSISRYPFQPSCPYSPIVARTRRVPSASSVPHSHQTGQAYAPRQIGSGVRGSAADVRDETDRSADAYPVVRSALAHLVLPGRARGISLASTSVGVRRALVLWCSSLVLLLQSWALGQAANQLVSRWNHPRQRKVRLTAPLRAGSASHQ